MYFLGVDGGGTKTSFVLSDEKGGIRGRFYSGGSDFISRSKTEVTEVINNGIAQACASAGISKADITYGVLGFSGYGETRSSAQELDEICANALSPDTFTCVSDSVIAWAGSLAMKPGINVIAGTGSIVFGMNSKGDSARASGWGAYCDEGSCQWFGNKAVGIFTKQADGRLPRTPLYGIIKEYFKLEEDLYFCHILNSELAGRLSSLARLQPLVEKAYDLGDPHARALYEQAAEELWLAVETAAKKLEFNGEKYFVSYSGGLFKSGDRILTPLRRKAKNQPAVFEEPNFEPDLGAVLMSMKLARAPVDFASISFSG